MSFSKTRLNTAQAIRDAAKRICATSKLMFTGYLTTLIKHAHKIFSLARNTTLNRLPDRRFLFGVRRHHSKHLDACDYISLLFTGGSATAH
jgi:hypothetical protein